MQKKKHVSLTITDEQCRKLDELAEQSMRTRSGYLRHLLAVYLRHIEKHPDEILT